MASLNRTITLSDTSSENEEPTLRLRLTESSSESLSESSSESSHFDTDQRPSVENVANKNNREPEVLRLRLRLYKLHDSDDKQSDSDEIDKHLNLEKDLKDEKENLTDADDEFSENEVTGNPPKKKRKYRFHKRRLVEATKWQSDRDFFRVFGMSKGQLILKCHFGVIISTENQIIFR